MSDMCMRCGSAIRWARADLTRCGYCSNDLTGQGKSISTQAMAAMRAVYGLLQDPAFADDAERVREMMPFRGMRDEKIVEFMFRLGLGVISSRRKLFSLEHCGGSVAIAHLALQAGLAAADEWPARFKDALRQTGYQWGASAENVPQRLGRAILQWLDQSAQGTGREVRAVLLEFSKTEPRT